MVTIVFWANSVQHFYGFTQFQRITNSAAQGLVHRGEYSNYFTLAQFTDGYHHLGKLSGILEGFHESAFAHFYIEDNGISSSGYLLAHNRGSNQRYRLHCACDIPERVHLAIGWRKISALTGEHDAVIMKLLNKLCG